MANTRSVRFSSQKSWSVTRDDIRLTNSSADLEPEEVVFRAAANAFLDRSLLVLLLRIGIVTAHSWIKVCTCFLNTYTWVIISMHSGKRWIVVSLPFTTFIMPLFNSMGFTFLKLIKEMHGVFQPVLELALTPMVVPFSHPSLVSNFVSHPSRTSNTKDIPVATCICHTGFP